MSPLARLTSASSNFALFLTVALIVVGSALSWKQYSETRRNGIAMKQFEMEVCAAAAWKMADMELKAGRCVIRFPRSE